MLSLVQASEQELKEGLKSKHAFEMDGKRERTEENSMNDILMAYCRLLSYS